MERGQSPRKHSNTDMHNLEESNKNDKTQQVKEFVQKLNSKNYNRCRSVEDFSYSVMKQKQVQDNQKKVFASVKQSKCSDQDYVKSILEQIDKYQNDQNKQIQLLSKFHQACKQSIQDNYQLETQETSKSNQLEENQDQKDPNAKATFFLHPGINLQSTQKKQKENQKLVIP